MPGFKKHIAIFLFGIFFFPLAYQPFHVLRHHSQKTHFQHDCCLSKVEEQAFNYGQSINSANEKEEPCPICNYHFPINVLPKLYFFKSNNTLVQNSIAELKIRLPFQQVTSVKSPRAPPTQS